MEETKYVQAKARTLLYYMRAVNITILMALNSIAMSRQSLVPPSARA
jgi:hypothetical protein